MGTTFESFVFKKISNLRVAVPPKQEQKRILMKVNEWMENATC
jgi:restriction endonuclease S subunit